MTYKLLRSLIAPAHPQDKTFEQLVEALTKHYSPQPVEIMLLFKEPTAQQVGCRICC